jgi:HAE1 family hydrophobic/amphiphilic exporter-1
MGSVPLAIASGAGAIARQVMGTGIIGGMLAALVIAIFLIPMMFYVIEKLSKGKEETHQERTKPGSSQKQEVSNTREGE